MHNFQRFKRRPIKQFKLEAHTKHKARCLYRIPQLWSVFISLQCVAKFAYELHLDSAFAVAAAAAVGSAAVVLYLYWRAFIDFPTPPAIQAGGSQKRVAFIGGGSVGLVCAKSVLDEGMGAVLFEKASGGLTKMKSA